MGLDNAFLTEAVVAPFVRLRSDVRFGRVSCAGATAETHVLGSRSMTLRGVGPLLLAGSAN